MLERAKIQLIRSLQQRKNRVESGLFLAEGAKAVGELLLARRFRLEGLWALPSVLDALPEKSPLRAAEPISEREAERASLLQHPQGVLALFRLPEEVVPAPVSGISLAIDGVQDPGNLGTLLRTADWFGVRQILLSPDSADAFAPKTVQATMGALGRLSIHRLPLAPWLMAQKSDGVAICGTHLHGTPLREARIPPRAVVVMGHEGHGIRPEVESCVSQRLYIPPFPPDAPRDAHVESLNVAAAAAIVLAHARAYI